LANFCSRFNHLCAACAPLLCVQITFAVTSKDQGNCGSCGSCGCVPWDALLSALEVTWPYLLWVTGFASGVVYFIINACLGRYGDW
jgi:hypothetical protein